MSDYVSCGISGVPIGNGDKMKVVLLAPNKEVLHQPHNIKLGATFETATDLFIPFALPVSCEYDENEIVRSIVADETVKFLESRYDMNFQTFMEVVNDERSIYENGSPLFELFVEKKNIFKNYQYDGEKAFAAFGFIREGNIFYLEEFKDIKFELDKGKDKFRIIVGNVVFVEKMILSPLAEALEFIYRQTGNLLGVPMDKRTLAMELDNYSAMYVHEEVYKALSNHENTEIRDHSRSYLEFEMLLNALNKKMKSYVQRSEASKKVYSPEVLEALEGIDIPALNELFNPFYGPNTNYAIRFYNDMFVMREHYAYILDNENVKHSLIEFYFFTLAMWSANKVFIPSYCGEQTPKSKGLQHLNALTAKLLSNLDSN